MSKKREKHIIMFSGGASSAYVAKWVVDKYGSENCDLFFTDTLWEDEDNYRFMEDVAEYVGIEITRIVDGRTPEDIFFEDKMLGNSRLANCSSKLKIEHTGIYIGETILKGFTPILYFGIGPHERHRSESLITNYAHFFDVFGDPIECRFPMIDSISEDVKAKWVIENEWGIKLPRMYELGFHHANCSGRCVRGGQHHYGNLYLEWPEIFEQQENMEQSFRKLHGNYAMMKKNGTPYTLKEHRENVLEKLSKEELIKYAKQKDDDEVPCFCSFS